jgi:FkbM family methyltransferase
MRDHFGADVVMVEANPDLYLELAAENHGQIFRCAVSEKEGSTHFNIAKNDAGSSLLPLPENSEYNCVLRETVTVPTRTVASIIREIGWESVDLVKVDIEGAEIGVLTSLGTEVLSCVGQLTVEFHSDPIFQFDMTREVEDCLDRMRDHGFFVIDFTFPGRRDVLLLNTRLIEISLLRRVWWQLMYNPPKSVDRSLRAMMPIGVRRTLGRLRRRLSG